jgi:hypothetical protein
MDVLNRVSQRRVGVAVIGAALVAAIAGVAAAQSAAVGGGAGSQATQPEARFNYDRRLGGQPDQSGNASSVTTYVFSEDGRTFSVRLENGEITKVEIDGKKVANSRARKTDSGKIEVLKEDGGTWHTFEVPATPSAPSPRAQWTWQPGPQAAGGGAVNVENFNPPPVMLGITMSEPDDDVVEHLDVDPSEVIRVDSVLEGLPAQKAGLKVHDIIVAIDGDKPVSQDRLREILRSKKPGDTIKLSVISKGKQEDIKIKLDAYDPEKLGATGQMAFRVPGEMNLPFNVEGMQGLEGLFAQGLAEARPKLEEAKRALEQSLAELKESGELNADSMKEHAIEALSKALRSLEEASGSAARKLETMRQRGGEGGPATIEQRRTQRPQVYITPMPGGGQSDQFDRLTETLERMEKRLAELEKRLERRPRDRGGDERPDER